MIMRGSRSEKGKVLYHVNNVAAMYSQKIGNALRTIDTCYEGAEGNASFSVQGKAWH